MDNQAQDDTSAIPLLGKLPIVGNLFKSKAERSKQTELMVLITPRLVRPLNPDEVPPLPTKFKSFVPEGGLGWLMRRLRRTAAALARHNPTRASSKFERQLIHK